MRRGLAVSLLLPLLAACTVGPDYVRPPVDTPPSWRVSEQDARDLANSAWWEQFNDPVLNDLIRTALDGNKDLLIASARIEEYQARHGSAQSALFPQVALGAGANQQNTQTGNALKGRYDTYDTSLSASWEIDFWGKIRRQSEAARAQLLASEEGKQGVILSLVANVATAYVNLRDLDRQLEIAQSTLKTREESYAVFQERYAGGVISVLELSQNKSQYDEAQANIPSIEKSIAQQENALSLLLGRNPGPIARGNPIAELLLPAIPEGLPSALLERRPDIREAEQTLIAANAQIGVAKAAYFPSISLTGLFGVASGNLSNLFETSSKIWQYGTTASVPIFTAGKIGSQVEIAEAQQQQALFSYQKAIQTAFREVNDALTDQQQTGRQLAAQDKQVASLRQYDEVARLRYDEGYTDFLTVLDAERSLFNAELSFTQTRVALHRAMIGLYKAMGGGWMNTVEQSAATRAQ